MVTALKAPLGQGPKPISALTIMVKWNKNMKSKRYVHIEHLDSHNMYYVK